MKNTDFNHPDLPEYIRSIRKACGIKSETMAKALGVSQSQYSKMENGQKLFNEEHLLQIAGLFQMDTAILLKGFKRYIQVANPARSEVFNQMNRRRDELNDMENSCRDMIGKLESILGFISTVRNDRPDDAGQD